MLTLDHALYLAKLYHKNNSVSMFNPDKYMKVISSTRVVYLPNMFLMK